MLTFVARAEKRLRELQAELEREVQINAEGVAVTMAFDDITWVASYFGLEHPYLQHVIEPAQRGIPLTPQTPRSPIGGRLGEKLRGLKLATSPTELANSGGRSNSYGNGLYSETHMLTSSRTETEPALFRPWECGDHSSITFGTVNVDYSRDWGRRVGGRIT